VSLLRPARAIVFWLWLPLLAWTGCVPMRPAPVVSAPAAAAGVDPKREEFEAQVRPILEKRCTPCHFPGGKMYDRLPFDRPGTIRVLGTALFTRIHDEEERAVIRAFLGVPAEGLPEPP
jgi:hypothetical protein